MSSKPLSSRRSQCFSEVSCYPVRAASGTCADSPTRSPMASECQVECLLRNTGFAQGRDKETLLFSV